MPNGGAFFLLSWKFGNLFRRRQNTLDNSRSPEYLVDLLGLEGPSRISLIVRFWELLDIEAELTAEEFAEEFVLHMEKIGLSL